MEEGDCGSCKLSEYCNYKKEVKRQNQWFFCILAIIVGGTVLALGLLYSTTSEAVASNVLSDSVTLGNNGINENALNPKDLEAILEIRKNRTHSKQKEIFDQWNRTHPGQPFPVGHSWMKKKANSSHLTKHQRKHLKN